MTRAEVGHLNQCLSHPGSPRPILMCPIRDLNSTCMRLPLPTLITQVSGFKLEMIFVSKGYIWQYLETSLIAINEGEEYSLYPQQRMIWSLVLKLEDSDLNLLFVKELFLFSHNSILATVSLSCLDVSASLLYATSHTLQICHCIHF